MINHKSKILVFPCILGGHKNENLFQRPAHFLGACSAGITGRSWGHFLYCFFQRVEVFRLRLEHRYQIVFTQIIYDATSHTAYLSCCVDSEMVAISYND